MKMVTDGDDDQRSEEGSMGEKRCLDVLALIRGSYGEEETRSVRVREEEDSVSTELSLFGRRKIDDECKNQQNPTNYRQDYASSSSSSSSPWSLSSVESKRRRVVSQEPIRAEPLREVRPVIRRKKPVKPERWVTPEWLVNLMTRLKGVDAKLVIDKMIQKTDVNPNQGRLLIPFNQIVEMGFLNEAELNLIDEHQKDNSKKGVAVIVVASDGREWNAKLRRWNMNCPNYALCSGWNTVVRENNLKDKIGMGGVMQKFLVASMCMGILPIALLYGFNNDLLPDSTTLSPHSLTLLSGFLAVVSVNVVIVFYICLALKEPVDKHKLDASFVAEAKDSVKKLTSGGVPSTDPTLKKQE
ncbi:hypothetical protein Bca52824_010410 [Brassica carinata]|uniref:Vacuolar ATPase assembly integral membrane protein VMA21 homolog n=1 Tax=Brassica carinata TaxID=52824 RepID=A0A8X8BAP0_BRACI|nr:hypothetical protein Bca52824_010410 [Brassica carinata]